MTSAAITAKPQQPIEPEGEETRTDAPAATDLARLTTPALLLDRDKLRANASRLSQHIGSLGGVLRPHVKTHKSIDVTRDIIAAGNVEGITVSTLKEAAYFLDHGITDVFYAVGISPNKFDQARDLMTRGMDLKVTLDTPEMAEMLAAYGAARGTSFPVLIELDTDGHRSGTDPYGEDLLRIGEALHGSDGVELRGVMTHAGESYSCRTPESLLAMARQERDRSLDAARRLRAAGLPCPVVSVGSTPTAFAIDDLSGISEVRAGVYSTFDLVMAGIGVCAPQDIALSVLVTVTGYQKDKQWIITDGGWMAMSRDRGTADQEQDFGYGAVVDIDGKPLPLVMSGANQEHGIISPARDGQSINYAQFPLGSQLRVLPNHACATAAQYDAYDVLEGGRLSAHWSRSGGW
ncbi:MAG: alanine racemase [Pseudomonadota bacterium]